MSYNLRTDSHHQFENEKIGIGTFKISQINNSGDFTYVCEASQFLQKISKIT